MPEFYSQEFIDLCKTLRDWVHLLSLNKWDYWFFRSLIGMLNFSTNLYFKKKQLKRRHTAKKLREANVADRPADQP
tara:strand:+ start:177 stop:404 length:228 start_codon:yes stop_codon:yes gene_type:complete